MEEDAYYTYDDEWLTFTVAVPTVAIFMAFIEELQKLEKFESINQHITAIARAFWVLHQSERFIGPRVPKIKDRAALAFLNRKIPRADYVMPSLYQALLGIVSHVVGKKKVAREVDSAEPEKPSAE